MTIKTIEELKSFKEVHCSTCAGDDCIRVSTQELRNKFVSVYVELVVENAKMLQSVDLRRIGLAISVISVTM